MKSTDIQPCHNRVLLRLDVPETKIISVDSVERIDNTITVMAVGPDVKCVKVGDHVMLLPEANKFEPVLEDYVPGKVLFALCHDSHILAVLRPA